MVCLPATTIECEISQEGVILVFRYQPKVCIVESTRFHGPNVVSCEVISGGKWNPLIVVYLPTSTLEHLLDLEEALKNFRDEDAIVLENLKANIGQDQNLRSQYVADLIMEFGLVDLIHNFR